MNIRFKYISMAVANMATAMLFIAILIFSFPMSAAKNNNLTKPDFAYPQTVRKDAKLNLKSALSSDNWQMAVLATIQEITAANLIDRDSVDFQIQRLDSLITIAPMEWRPAFQLIEAHVYNSIYRDCSWKADYRSLPDDSVPVSPFEWSKEQFADKIYSICRSITDNNSCDGRPLKVWNGILSQTEAAFKYGMTIDEFLAFECADLLSDYTDATENVIPFYKKESSADTPADKCISLRNQILETLMEKTTKQNQTILEAEAIVLKAENENSGIIVKNLMSALKRLKDTEGSQRILVSLQPYATGNWNETDAPYKIDRKQYADLLRRSLSQFPQGVYANNLRNILEEITNPEVTISFDNQYLASSDISMMATLSNCRETYILIYDYSNYSKEGKTPRIKEVAGKSRLVKSVKVSADGETPFTAVKNVVIGKLPAGIYAAIPSATPDGKGIYTSISRQYCRDPFRVSDISVFSLSNLDGTARAFVVDGANGRPIEGAKVDVYSQQSYRSGRKLISSLTTGNDGSVLIKDKYCDIEASYGDSYWTNNLRIYNVRTSPDTTTRRKVSVLTDRSICHPGDSISAALISYSAKGQALSIDAGRHYYVNLINVNGKKVDSAQVCTDRYGRATADFIIPGEGLLGSWKLSITDERDTSYGSTYFEVADYVAPTFFITLESSDSEVSAGDTINLKGQVMTYSGMPLAESKVDFTVRYMQPRRWFFNSGATFSSSVKTDNEGKYLISLPTVNLKDTPFEKGIFSVSISSTSPSGETQSGPGVRFALGQEYDIMEMEDDKKYEISDSLPVINIKVTDILGKEVSKPVHYTLKLADSDQVMAEGTFQSPSFVLPPLQYESAKYDLEISLEEDPEIETDFSFILWRKSDTRAPAGVGLWLPQVKYQASPSEKVANVVIGSGKPDRWVPIVLSGDNKIIDFRWIHIETDNVILPIAFPSGENEYILDINYISDLSVKRKEISLFPTSYSDRMEIITESFRDKISAGDKEHWKFRFARKYSKTGEIPALAVMTDAALNHLAPFRWNFRPSDIYYISYAYFNNTWNAPNYSTYSLKEFKHFAESGFKMPHINNYNQNWGLNGISGDDYVVMGYGVVARSESRMLASMSAPAFASNQMKKEVKYEVADAEDEDESEVTVDGLDYDDESSENPDTSELRESECPVAFFMPGLVSDKDGMVEINFIVPNFNTTWALQLLGYDENLKTAYKSLETVASKPVMVSTHSPRFVRTSDEVLLTATIFNNTGDKAEVKGRIELVDLISGKTIESRYFAPECIERSGSRLISILWKVPADVSAVGFRAYAEADNHRDGEQALLPVVPASSPVVESTPFWLAPGQRNFEIKLPKFRETDQLTLQYCGNPAWYCLTALPDIMQIDSKSALVKSANLFCNATAFNLISRNASLKDGLTALLSDKNSPFAELKSNLEKDGNLKLSRLQDTPWVNDAESETLRMSRLSSLLNEGDARNIISGEIADLKRSQHPDGGWGWCPDMQSSAFITRLILDDFAMMGKNGALDCVENAGEMIRSAIGYVDSEILEDYKKYHHKDKSLSYLLGWLYDRSCFSKELLPDGKISNQLAPIYSNAIRDIEREWKNLDIFDKATTAMLLWRNGKTKTALDILESLRQYSSHSEEKGTWFENLPSGLLGTSSLQTTAAVLNAFVEIKPDDSMVDGLRQWLILGRQMQDWGKNRYNVMVVNSILTSGSDWTNDSVYALPDIRLGSHHLDIPAPASLTGAFTMNLNAKEASSKTMRIIRGEESPAWGGVISQYEAPLDEITASEISGLSIRKQLVALADNGNGYLTPSEDIDLKKGMKVRVTLTIVNERDMDYVEIKDQRSACLEPVEQLSGYTSTDGLWYYEEVRDQETIIYLEHLPKGHHVITYECTVAQDGTFSCGIATLQSQYSPSLVCHSAADIIEVK